MEYRFVWLMCILGLAGVDAEGYVVNIQQGPVRGYTVPGVEVIAYYGIPYATMPKSRDRFKAPLPPPTWTEPFEAVEDTILCPQYPEYLPLAQTEDCLVINVFVPKGIQNKTQLPVMAFIHGGGFQIGYSNWYSPTQLTDQKRNIVTVTFNYRLGPLGFLCLGTEDVPGNAGMKDQIAALRWVQDNIANFQGNPDDVTVAGCSAGSVSVDLFTLSKMAKGLFKKVIGMSGANIAAFAVQVDPTKNARDYARDINYTGVDRLEEVEEFYKTISLEQLNSVNNYENIDNSVKFSPCIERDLGAERFLDDTPLNIMLKGDYDRFPVLYGFTNMEGLMRIRNFEEWKVGMNKDFSDYLPEDLGFENETQKREVANRIKEFYFGNQTISGENIQSYIDYNSDVVFVVSMHRSLSLQVRAGTTMYLQVFSFTDNNTIPIPYSGLRGAIHCSQSDIVMDQDVSLQTPENLELSKIMRDLWLNFIITGNPTPIGQTPPEVPHWYPATEHRTPLMHFGETIELNGPYEKHRQEFWDDIYDRFHKQPVEPYDF